MLHYEALKINIWELTVYNIYTYKHNVSKAHGYLSIFQGWQYIYISGNIFFWPAMFLYKSQSCSAYV